MSDNEDPTNHQQEGRFVTNLRCDEQANYLVISPNIGGAYCDVICADFQPMKEYFPLETTTFPLPICLPPPD